MSEPRVPDSPLSPSQAKNATGTGCPAGNEIAFVESAATSGRRNVRLHSPLSNVASAVSPLPEPGAGSISPGPRPSISAPPSVLDQCHM